MITITAYTIDEKEIIDVGEKQIAKLHEEGKYARESVRNYGDYQVCVIICFSLFSSTGI